MINIQVGPKYGPLLRLHEVRRWSMVQMHRDQSVAEHSFNVIVIADAIAAFLDLGWMVDKALLREWAMYHDAEEYWTTDIPSPVKARMTMDGQKVFLEQYIHEMCSQTINRYNELRSEVEGTEIEAIVKLADRAETLAYFQEYSVKQDPSVHRYLCEALESALAYTVRACHIRNSVDDANLRNLILEITTGNFIRRLTQMRCGGTYHEPIPRAAEDPDTPDDIPF